MSDTIANTSSGRVRGRSEQGINVFKGIPYAAPPVGELRFRPPEAPEPWTGVRDALGYGPSCPQPAARPEGWAPEPSLSEDCLYVNVWTPGVGDGAGRPVMVWLHGGGYSIGSGSWPVYDGTALARRGDVVVVTVNHRLGIFGYLHLAEFIGDDFASSSNAGMLDLVAALEWVRDNIAELGGDPANVTLFGESGGGAKVSTLHVMPRARGLFHRAIVQSGPGLRVKTAAQAAEQAEKTLGELGIERGNIRALQSMPADRLLEAHLKLGRGAVFGFSPVLHPVELPDHPGDALRKGTAADVPLIVGCNRDEATLFLAMYGGQSNGDGASIERRLSPMGADISRVIEGYRKTRPEASDQELLVAIESDRMMRIPSIRMAERKLAGTNTPVYMYVFRWAAGPLGSAHGYEIPFVFDNARPPVMPESVSRGDLAARMSEAWIAFARSGSPNHAAIPAWPAYTMEERKTMIFDRDVSLVEADPCGEERAIWETTDIPTGVPA